jgi:hypothetical protein
MLTRLIPFLIKVADIAFKVKQFSVSVECIASADAVSDSSEAVVTQGAARFGAA